MLHIDAASPVDMLHQRRWWAGLAERHRTSQLRGEPSMRPLHSRKKLSLKRFDTVTWRS